MDIRLSSCPRGSFFPYVAVGWTHEWGPGKGVQRLLLMEEGNLDRLRREGANAAAEVLHIDERGENRHSFHSVSIGDSRRVGFEVTDSGPDGRIRTTQATVPQTPELKDLQMR